MMPARRVFRQFSGQATHVSISAQALLHPALISAHSKENGAKQAKKDDQAKAQAVRRVRVTIGIVHPLLWSKRYHSAPVASSLFLQHNTALVPPYRVLN